MKEYLDTASPFLEKLEKLFLSLNTQEDPWKAFRLKAWDHFLELGLPEQKGNFQYVPLSKLYETEWSLNGLQPMLSRDELLHFVLPECQRSYIVLVNGVLRLDLSDVRSIPRSVTMLSLKDAAHSYGAFLQARFAKMLKEEIDPFVILNAALHQGAFIMIPSKLKIEAPLQCLEIITTSEKPKIIASRVHVVMGADSEVTLITTASCPKDHENSYWSHSVLDIALEEGAKLQLASSKQHSDRSFIFDAMRTTLKRNSEISSIAIHASGQIVRDDYHISLSGPLAKANIKSLTLLDQSRQTHTHINMHHLAESCESMQLVKSALSDVSKASFEGKIFVAKEAQKTAAYQLNNNLLLGEYASAMSKPNLEIFADDVKASHGATVSQLNPEQLFYLKTRGLDEMSARGLLVGGFCKEIASQLFLDSLRIEVFQKIEEFTQGHYVTP